MSQFIKNLREKPDHVKQMFSLFVALGVTGLIAVCWVIGIIYGGLVSPKSAETASNDDNSPLAVIKNQFSEFSKSAGDQMASVGSAFNSMAQQSNSTSSTNGNQ